MGEVSFVVIDRTTGEMVSLGIELSGGGVS